MSLIIECKFCDAVIAQLAVGVWMNEHGNVFCPNGLEERIFHEPVIDAEWQIRIRRLNQSNPNFWTVRELAKVMLLTETQVQGVLESV